MKFEGTFINEKGREVNWWFEAPSEDALKQHLEKIGWKIVSMYASAEIKAFSQAQANGSLAGKATNFMSDVEMISGTIFDELLIENKERLPVSRAAVFREIFYFLNTGIWSTFQSLGEKNNRDDEAQNMCFIFQEKLRQLQPDFFWFERESDYQKRLDSYREGLKGQSGMSILSAILGFAHFGRPTLDFDERMHLGLGLSLPSEVALTRELYTIAEKWAEWISGELRP